MLMKGGVLMRKIVYVLSLIIELICIGLACCETYDLADCIRKLNLPESTLMGSWILLLLLGVLFIITLMWNLKKHNYTEKVSISGTVYILSLIIEAVCMWLSGCQSYKLAYCISVLILDGNTRWLILLLLLLLLFIITVIQLICFFRKKK